LRETVSIGFERAPARIGGSRASGVPAIPFFPNNGFHKTENHASVNFAMTTNCPAPPSALALTLCTGLGDPLPPRLKGLIGRELDRLELLLA